MRPMNPMRPISPVHPIGNVQLIYGLSMVLLISFKPLLQAPTRLIKVGCIEDIGDSDLIAAKTIGLVEAFRRCKHDGLAVV